MIDNGTVYPTRFAGGRGGRNHLELELRRLGIVQKNSRPNHPTCGKVERFQQTLKRWLAAQPAQPATLAELQALLDVFVPAYNHQRPHRSLPHRATPATAYAARPKATPGTDRDRDTHDRVRVRTDKTDRPDASPCAWPAGCTTSASAEPTPEATSCWWSRTSTSASSTPPPANSSASSPSTPPATTGPPASHPDPSRKSSRPDPRIVGPGYADVLRHHVLSQDTTRPTGICAGQDPASDRRSGRQGPEPTLRTVTICNGHLECGVHAFRGRAEVVSKSPGQTSRVIAAEPAGGQRRERQGGERGDVRRTATA
ncbi:integrase core domain-containing protein [Geodermatophilus sp. SYSU D01176]